ncbi:MAG: hypothetical protein HY817_00065 [Candidatus Abawacabacteria bacterium]|nr:hypothetical protein [Candidatus Abawacabacteria bacterium]
MNAPRQNREQPLPQMGRNLIAAILALGCANNALDVTLNNRTRVAGETIRVTVTCDDTLNATATLVTPGMRQTDGGVGRSTVTDLSTDALCSHRSVVRCGFTAAGTLSEVCFQPDRSQSDLVIVRRNGEERSVNFDICANHAQRPDWVNCQIFDRTTWICAKK